VSGYEFALGFDLVRLFVIDLGSLTESVSALVHLFLIVHVFVTDLAVVVAIVLDFGFVRTP
jgi:hypothetical protein